MELSEYHGILMGWSLNRETMVDGDEMYHRIEV